MGEDLSDKIINGVDTKATNLDIYVSKSDKNYGTSKLAGAPGRILGKGETRFSRRTSEASTRAAKFRDYAHEIRMYVNKLEDGRYIKSKIEHDFSCVSVMNIDFTSSETDDIWDEKQINEDVNYKSSDLTIQLAQSCASKKKNGFIDFYHKEIEKKTIGPTEHWPFELYFEFNSHSPSVSGAMNRLKNVSHSVFIIKFDNIRNIKLRREFLILKKDEDDSKERQDYWVFTITGEASFVNSVSKPPVSLSEKLKEKSNMTVDVAKAFGTSGIGLPGGTSSDAVSELIDDVDDDYFELDALS